LSFLTSGACATMGGVKILLRNPKRELEVAGPVGVLSLLRQLGYKREAVLVIVNGTLVTEDATIAEGSEVEIRPVISGGAVALDDARMPRSGSRPGSGGPGRSRVEP
jgi:sulfur carrier protein